MADSTRIIPFIKSVEGGFSVNPIEVGGEVNKGIGWGVWKQYFGNTHDRYLAMSDDDWYHIFKNGYWDAIKGDQIQNQALADFIVDWFWGSGVYATKHLQKVLNTFGNNLSVDGVMGPKTLAALNAAEPRNLLNALTEDHEAFYRSIAASDPDLAPYLQGWLNRLNGLYAQVSTYVSDVTTAITENPKSTGTVLFFCLLQF